MITGDHLDAGAEALNDCLGLMHTVGGYEWDQMCDSMDIDGEAARRTVEGILASSTPGPNRVAKVVTYALFLGILTARREQEES